MNSIESNQVNITGGDVEMVTPEQRMRGELGLPPFEEVIKGFDRGKWTFGSTPVDMFAMACRHLGIPLTPEQFTDLIKGSRTINEIRTEHEKKESVWPFDFEEKTESQEDELGRNYSEVLGKSIRESRGDPEIQIGDYIFMQSREFFGWCSNIDRKIGNENPAQNLWNRPRTVKVKVTGSKKSGNTTTLCVEASHVQADVNLYTFTAVCIRNLNL